MTLVVIIAWRFHLSKWVDPVRKCQKGMFLQCFCSGIWHWLHMLFSWITLLSQSSCHISDRLFTAAGTFLLQWLCDFYHFYSCLPFISMSLPLFPQVSNSLYRSDSLYWSLPLYRSLLVSNSLYTLYQFLPISLVCWAVTFELHLLNSWTHW